MDKVKASLVASVSSSIALVCVLLVFVLGATKETRNDTGMIISLPAILLLTVCAIIEWVKYLRRYVDFAIEKKLKDTSQETKD